MCWECARYDQGNPVRNQPLQYSVRTHNRGTPRYKGTRSAGFQPGAQPGHKPDIESEIEHEKRKNEYGQRDADAAIRVHGNHDPVDKPGVCQDAGKEAGKKILAMLPLLERKKKGYECNVGEREEGDGGL